MCATGFAGRAAGRITHDGETVVVNVFLFNATGTVTGHVFRADGVTPVPNAEVVISNGDGPLAFAVTDADGAYEQDTIPLGLFQVDVFEAATAARAFGTGRIDVDHQVRSRGRERSRRSGWCAASWSRRRTGTPLKGWLVSLRQVAPSGLALPERVTNTGVDGGFSFPGTSVGAFQMSASRSGVSGVCLGHRSSGATGSRRRGAAGGHGDPSGLRPHSRHRVRRERRAGRQQPGRTRGRWSAR